METSKVELAQIEMTNEQVNAEMLKNLNDLQLALVGGGSGDVVFA